MICSVPMRCLITAAVLAVSAFSQKTGASDDQKTLTWDHVYGREKIVIRDPAPRGFQWLDDTTLLHQDDHWMQTDAVSGISRPYFQADRLQRRLRDAGATSEDAQEIADGNWTIHDPQQRLCVLHSEGRLIRAGLDGDRIRVLQGLPQDAELLTLSPDGRVCAFVAANNLWCADFERGSVRQLTAESRPHVRSGKADWVYFEEVLRRKWKAFEFSPDGRYLLFQRFDDTDVPEFTVIDHAKPAQATEQEKYPRAGDPNPTVRLGIVPVRGGRITWASSPYDDPTTLITGFGWLPDSRHVYWYAQDRSQTWLEAVRTSRDTGISDVWWRESTPAWVSAPEDPVFLNDGSLLILSERSGWKHVDRISSDGTSRQALTSGPWDVSGICAVNEEAGWMLVTGTRDSGIADGVYRVALQDGSVTRLSDQAGHHVVTASPDGGLYVDTWSSHVTRSSVAVCDSTGSVRRTIHEATPPEEWTELSLGEVSIRTVPLADEESGNALFVLPPEFDESQPHPVWLKIYGGPRYARVRDAWRSRLSDHLLASHGVVVISFDPRTAGGHGAAGAWKAWRQLGVEETRDVEAVCAWLRQQPWADAGRIGLSGHSYGGYLTSYVMTHSDCIAAGIAGSPVTDWANYDTIYTERYMGTPQENPDGYRKASVVSQASRLHGRLLLVHGLRDDNVHPANTFQLVRALQQAGRRFDLMIYPQSRHAIHEQHYSRLRYDFILESLGIEQNAE